MADILSQNEVDLLLNAVTEGEVEIAETEKERMLDQICGELVARGNQYGFTLEEIVAHLQRRIENGD